MLRDVLIQKGLSNREAEVAELVSKGLSNKEVANQLFVTEKTVKFHLTNIYKKMNVKSRAQLIVWCLPHLGFVENENREQTQIVSVNANNFTANIPTGNSPVGQTIQTIIPGRANDIGGNRGGSSDVGAMGM
ncbi:MAG: helix-turn-helix transcriptional regulator [Bdellovibrio sp.]